MWSDDRDSKCRAAVAIILWCATVFAAGACTGAEAEDELAQVTAQHMQLLQQHHVDSDTASLIGYLRGLASDAKREEEIARLVAQLGDDDFNAREAAAKRLALLGEDARRALAAAQQSRDAEVVWRASQLLHQLESGQQAELNRGLLLAVLVLLKQQRSPESPAALLAALPQCDQPHLVDAACEALWASVDHSHTDLLRNSLPADDANVVAAAIVALEVAVGDEATATIEDYFASGTPQLRLAAARALIDRQPRSAARVLVELTQSPDENLAAQAAALLAVQTGQALGEVDWLRWRAEQMADAQLAVLGAARLDLSLGRRGLRETFATGLGRWQYESAVGRALRVQDGVAAIGGGEQEEGDQRLFITAQRLVGRPEFPQTLEVRARLGAENSNNYGWHIGLAVGRVKVLFHPGVDGGAFRAETVDEHEYLFGNEEMGFTPAPDVMHDMSIAVRRTAKGARFEVTIVDGSNPKHRFTHTFHVARRNLGKLNRIGLERSGREGGAALFDDVTIRLN